MHHKHVWQTPCNFYEHALRRILQMHFMNVLRRKAQVSIRASWFLGLTWHLWGQKWSKPWNVTFFLFLIVYLEFWVDFMILCNIYRIFISYFFHSHFEGTKCYFFTFQPFNISESCPWFFLCVYITNGQKSLSFIPFQWNKKK